MKKFTLCALIAFWAPYNGVSAQTNGDRISSPATAITIDQRELVTNNEERSRFPSFEPSPITLYKTPAETTAGQTSSNAGTLNIIAPAAGSASIYNTVKSLGTITVKQGEQAQGSPVNITQQQEKVDPMLESVNKRVIESPQDNVRTNIIYNTDTGVDSLPE